MASMVREMGYNELSRDTHVVFPGWPQHVRNKLWAEGCAWTDRKEQKISNLRPASVS